MNTERLARNGRFAALVQEICRQQPAIEGEALLVEVLRHGSRQDLRDEFRDIIAQKHGDGAALALSPVPPTTSDDERRRQVVSSWIASTGGIPHDRPYDHLAQITSKLTAEEARELADVLTRASALRERQKGRGANAFLQMLRNNVEAEERAGR